MRTIVIIFLTIFAIIIFSGCVGISDNRQSENTDHPADTRYKPEYNQVQTAIPTLNPITSRNLLIDNISRDLETFNKKGWNKLYETNEFDCSRMTTFMWDHIRKKYKLSSKIIVAPDREHAWLAIRVKDAGKTDRYLNWTIRDVDYYFIESTIPAVVIYEKDVYFGDKWYSSNEEFYTTRIFVADDPSEANEIAGRWSTEFRLTKPDLDKLGTFGGN
jgi:hypothetical protein